MKIVYLGCEGAPTVSVHYGVEFTIGVPSEVTDESAIAKLVRHPHFAVAGETVAAPVADEPQAGQPMDIDAMDKLQLEALGRQYGIEVDRRKSLAFIRQQVREAMESA